MIHDLESKSNVVNMQIRDSRKADIKNEILFEMVKKLVIDCVNENRMACNILKFKRTCK